MKEMVRRLCERLDRGEKSVLVTVLEKSGSAPRGAGACMLVAEQAAFGTIGGGSAEYAAQEQARQVLAEGRVRVETYRMSPDEAAGLGMVCGGTARVLFHPIAPTPEHQAVFHALLDAQDAGRDAWLLRRFAGCVCTELRALTEPEAEWTAGTPICRETDDGFAFAEPVSSASRILVFGGGHVSQRLVPLLHFLGLRTVVCEDRPEFADWARFPDADELILAEYDHIADRLSIGASDCVVVMTRGHQADYTILGQALQTPAFYIGCIGSRKKIAFTRERLLADGFSETDYARIHTPIGLPIGAETPEEIAVSVAAELIEARANRKNG